MARFRQLKHLIYLKHLVNCMSVTGLRNAASQSMPITTTSALFLSTSIQRGTLLPALALAVKCEETSNKDAIPRDTW